jgi:hypothetical protein
MKRTLSLVFSIAEYATDIALTPADFDDFPTTKPPTFDCMESNRLRSSNQGFEPIGAVAIRVVAAVIAQRLKAAHDLGAPSPPPANDNAAPGQISKLTSASDIPCSVSPT